MPLNLARLTLVLREDQPPARAQELEEPQLKVERMLWQLWLYNLGKR